MIDKTFNIRRVSDGYIIPAGTVVMAMEHPTLSDRYRIVGGLWNTWTVKKSDWFPYDDPTIFPPELFEL